MPLLTFNLASGMPPVLKGKAILSHLPCNRFANADYALAHALRQHLALMPETKEGKASVFIFNCDVLGSYDIACAFGTNIEERFAKNFPDLLDIVKNIRWLVPLLHIQNHKDNCTYLYSSAYTENAGHFYGETAEHVWPELNQIGTQIRQMNNGNRQDTLIDVQGDWNFKKMANICKFLIT